MHQFLCSSFTFLLFCCIFFRELVSFFFCHFFFSLFCKMKLQLVKIFLAHLCQSVGVAGLYTTIFQENAHSFWHQLVGSILPLSLFLQSSLSFSAAGFGYAIHIQRTAHFSNRVSLAPFFPFRSVPLSFFFTSSYSFPLLAFPSVLIQNQRCQILHIYGKSIIFPPNSVEE